MPNPIWIDSCAIIDIAEGDTALEAEILARRNASGGKLLMVPKVQEEVLLGNPLKKQSAKAIDKRIPFEKKPDQIQACRNVIQRMNIELDTMGTKADREEFFQKQFFVKGDKDTWGSTKKDARVSVQPIEESDATILSQIAASAKARNIQKPELHTSEKRLVNNASVKVWNVTVIGRITSAKTSSGNSGGGAGSGGQSGPGGIPPIPLTENGVSTNALRGLIRVGLSSLGLAVLVAIAQHFRQKLEEQIIIKQIQNLEPEMLARLAKLKTKRASIQSEGGQPHAVINIEILVVITTEFGNGRPIKDATLPLVTLESVEVRRFSVATSAGKPQTKRGSFGQTEERTIAIQWSVPVLLNLIELQEFVELKRNKEWCEAILKESNLPMQDRERIEKDLNRLQFQFQRWMERN